MKIWSNKKYQTMKKVQIISSLLVIYLLVVGCSIDHLEHPKCIDGCEIPSATITTTSSKEFDQELLRKLVEAVYKESKSNFCQRGDTWGIAGVGAKPCGGPASYMAYKKDNEKCFFKVLTVYNQQAKLYNAKYQIVSNCAVEPEPESVDCKEGKPVLVY